MEDARDSGRWSSSSKICALLSAYYKLATVASTAGNTFTGLGNLPSVSNSGDIAFTGSTGTGVFGDSGLYVETASTNTLVNINPTFSSDPSRSFGQEAAIDDDDLVTARDQVASSPSQFLVRQWNAAQLNSNAYPFTYSDDHHGLAG